jgi:hypothetical protein
MKNFKPILLLLMAMSLLFNTAMAQDGPMIRVYNDDMKRQYKILFSAKEEHKVEIRLVNSQNQELFNDHYIEKSFLKRYSLGQDLQVGSYRFLITFDGTVHEHAFEVMSPKKLRSESVKAEMDDLLNLTISVKAYNKDPLSIFLYKDNGEQLEYFFWEPDNDLRKKIFNLSKYDAYEVKLEVMQLGDPLLVKRFPLY